jgi:hypothetical protein
MIVNVVVTLIACYFLYDAIRAYKSAIGTIWGRIIAATKGAAASLWTGFTVLAALLAQGLAQLADILNAPAVASAIQTYLGPKEVAAIMVAIAIITELRRRTQV